MEGWDAEGRDADRFARIRDVLVVSGDVYAITTNRSPRRDGASQDSMIRLDP